MASTKNRSCKSSKTKMTNNQCFHVSMDDEAYPIDIVRATLKSVLSPMGIRFTVRGRENEKMGEYASISITPPASNRKRKSN